MGLTHGSAVATPELIGVLAWWAVVLPAPLFLLRRWSRRRRAERHLPSEDQRSMPMRT